MSQKIDDNERWISPRRYLEGLRTQLIDLGFQPLRISQTDVACMYVTFECEHEERAGEYRESSLTAESIEDALWQSETATDTLKGMLRYDDER